MNTPQKFAHQVAQALQIEYPDLTDQIDQEIEQDRRDPMTTVVVITGISRLVWEIVKFVWLKKKLPSPPGEDEIRREAVERFEGQQAIKDTDKLIDVVEKIVEIGKSII